MATKTELADAAQEIAAKEYALAINGYRAADGVQALATLSDEDFEARLAQLKKGRERVARAQREYMVLDEDYGLIPGTPKPTLFKSGAEKLAQLYGLAARVETRFESGDGEKTPPLTFYAEAFLHVGSFSGPIVAVGHGTANSWEKRYRRDSKVCPNCSQPKIIRSKYGAEPRGWYCLNCKSQFGHNDASITDQVGPATGDVREAYDLGVTLLKMSEKRAFVGSVLRATATSGLFTQDVAEEPVEESAARIASVAQRPSGEATGASTTATPQIEKTEWTAKPEVLANDAEVLGRILEATGGELVEEEVKLGPSNVEGVERGGRTAGANEAQISEVRRLAGELSWGSRAILDYADSLLELGVDIPEDGRVARSTLTALLDQMSSANIGTLIQGMRQEAEGREPAVITP